MGIKSVPFFSSSFYKCLARSSRLLILRVLHETSFKVLSPTCYQHHLMFSFFLVTADAAEASKWLWATSKHCSEYTIMGRGDQLLNATCLASLQLGDEDPSMTAAQSKSLVLGISIHITLVLPSGLAFLFSPNLVSDCKHEFLKSNWFLQDHYPPANLTFCLKGLFLIFRHCSCSRRLP